MKGKKVNQTNVKMMVQPELRLTDHNADKTNHKWDNSVTTDAQSI